MTRLTPDWIACCLNEKNGPSAQEPFPAHDGAGLNVAPPLTQAAVLVPLVPVNEALWLLFIRRTWSVAHHKGQIAFPGGRAEEQDPNPLATALRETREELGLDTRSIRILGQLEPVATTQTGFLIHPFVGVLPMEFQLQPDPQEVAGTLMVPLDFFLAAPRSVGESRYLYQNELIWGATARIMTLLVAQLLTESSCAS